MLQSLRELIARRDLVYILAWREIKIRYKQSVMGLLWAILMPLVIVCSGVVVRYAFSRMSGAPLALADVTAVAVKAVPWAFVVGAVRFGTNSLVTNSNLVTKVYMPRLAFPISAVGAQLLDFLIAGIVIALLLVAAQVGISIHLLWVPALISCLILMTAAFAVILSAASLFLRDVKYLVDVFLTFAIFFTPVFYSAALFGDRGKYLLLNPVAPLLEGLDAAIVQGRAPDAFWTAYAAIWAFALLLFTPAFFLRLEPKFAESV